MLGGERDAPTLPPCAEETLALVEFERAVRTNENDARLAELERLRPLWEADRE